MTKEKVFLIKAELGRTGTMRECVMRLPVGRYGGITTKGMHAIAERFFDGTTQTPGTMRYALCLEAFSTADELTKALENYKKNVI